MLPAPISLLLLSKKKQQSCMGPPELSFKGKTKETTRVKYKNEHEV